MHWLDTQEYPFQHRFTGIDHQRMHYIDEGMGETILFVHGTPSWSFDFRIVIKALRKTHRCLAVDHIGFGLSDKPRHYAYSTQQHARNLEEFILTLNLQSITLVVHDFGGPIGFDVAMRHPDRIKGIVVLNSWLWSSEGDPDFEKMKRILKSPLLPFLYVWLNFSPRFILPQSFGEKKLPKHLLAQFTKPFSRRSERYGALAFARSLLNDQQWFESLWQKRSILSEKLLLLIWGMKDPVIKPQMLEKFLEGFPKAKAVRLTTAGHFPQEEEPSAVIQAMRDFIGG